MRQACQRLARKHVCGRDLFVIEDNDLSQLEKLKQDKVISYSEFSSNFSSGRL